MDVNLGDGTITFNGKNGNFFIQPTALSFGWGGSLELPPEKNAIRSFSVNQIVVDFDIGGPNFLSLKVSYAQGVKNIAEEAYIDGTKVQATGETDLEVTVNTHRWPRIVAAIGAVYVLFQAGVLETVYTGAPVLAKRLVSIAQRIPQWLQPLFAH